MRDLGVCEKVDVREPIEKYQVAPADTKLIDTNEASEEEPMKLRTRIVSRELKSGDRPDLYAGTLPLQALKAISCIAAHHNRTFSIMHIDVCWYVCQRRTECWTVWIEDKRMVGTRDAANREREWREHLKSWRYQLGLGSENLFRHEEHRVSGMSHGDEFVATGPTDRLAHKRTNLQGEPKSEQKSSVMGQPKATKR